MFAQTPTLYVGTTHERLKRTLTKAPKFLQELPSIGSLHRKFLLLVDDEQQQISRPNLIVNVHTEREQELFKPDRPKDNTECSPEEEPDPDGRGILAHDHADICAKYKLHTNGVPVSFSYDPHALDRIMPMIARLTHHEIPWYLAKEQQGKRHVHAITFKKNGKYKLLRTTDRDIKYPLNQMPGFATILTRDELSTAIKMYSDAVFNPDDSGAHERVEQVMEGFASNAAPYSWFYPRDIVEVTKQTIQGLREHLALEEIASRVGGKTYNPDHSITQQIKHLPHGGIVIHGLNIMEKQLRYDAVVGPKDAERYRAFALQLEREYTQFAQQEQLSMRRCLQNA